MKILPPNKIEHKPSCRYIKEVEKLLKSNKRVLIPVNRNYGRKYLFEKWKELFANDKLRKN